MKHYMRVTPMATFRLISHEMLFYAFDVDCTPVIVTAIADLDDMASPAGIIAVGQVRLVKSIYKYGISPSKSPRSILPIILMCGCRRPGALEVVCQ